MAQMLGGDSGSSGGMGNMLEKLPMGAGGGMGLFASPGQEQGAPQSMSQQNIQSLMQKLMASAAGKKFYGRNSWR